MCVLLTSPHRVIVYSSDGNVERERKQADENTASQLTRTPSFEKDAAGPGRQRYADLFDAIDTDRSGLITVIELRAFMRREHTYKTEEQCRHLFNLMDTNHDKSVSRREFERFRSQHPVLISLSLEKLVEVSPSRTKMQRKKYLSLSHIHKKILSFFLFLSSFVVLFCFLSLSLHSSLTRSLHLYLPRSLALSTRINAHTG